MSIIVYNRKFKVGPRKVRGVADMIRRKSIDEAMQILQFCEKKEIAQSIRKLLWSGITIALDSQKYDLDNLYVDSIQVNEGRTLKRIQPRAQGRAFRINKRSSHITLSLAER